MACDEWNSGPKEAGAGGPPHPRPHEGRQAAHHGAVRLGKRVSTAYQLWLQKHATLILTERIVAVLLLYMFQNIIIHRLHFLTSLKIYLGDLTWLLALYIVYEYKLKSPCLEVVLSEEVAKHDS